MTDQGPAVLKRHVGIELRKLRVAAGKTRDEAARHLDCSESKITKIELGYVAVKRSELHSLLSLYDAPEEADSLTWTASESKKRGWWSVFGPAVPNWFRTFIGLESSAEEISVYYNELVPGLLQTDAYIRAVISAVSPDLTPEQFEKRLRVRAERQARLLGDDPPRYLAVLNEAVLHRQVGGPEVMREQLRFLLDIQKRKPVQVRVLPFAAGAHAAIGFSFVLLRHADQSEPGTAYVEGLTRASCYDHVNDPDDVTAYRAAFAGIRRDALGLKDSARLIGRLMADL